MPTRDELVALYASVGWTSYTAHPAALERAVEQSSCVVCARSDEGEPLGLACIVSDDVSIRYVQGILVRPSTHRRGTGRQLMEAVLVRYPHVMQQVLLTDDGAAHQAFHRALGFHTTRAFKQMTTSCSYRRTRHELA